MNFYRKLKELRNKKNVSQNKLAKHLNVKQATVSKWEQQINQPDYETLVKIAEYFDVSLDFLLDHENHIKAEEELKKLKVKNIYDLIELVQSGIIELVDEPLPSDKVNEIINFIEFQLNKNK